MTTASRNLTQERAADMAQEPQRRTVTIVNRRGLHARASAKFVSVAERYQADIEVSKDGTTVSGTSIMGLMMLAAAPGDQITLSGSGPDVGAALDDLQQMIKNKFGEE
tara:strand:- start:2322 stop:2645 length:324 start_codon:yes stop_codon:yes gene_type:complete